ncbi:probable serine/threonine-protein kinase DDB_G0280111 [Sipha flava]|nr:probable serine/threonine-protein kinase DDB_G0280111 [Sipha flava]
METEINARRKYDKLKMRLCMIEKAEVTNQINTQQIMQNINMLSSSVRTGGVIESMTNVHCDKRYQQAYSYSPPPVKPITSLLESASPSIPPPPPSPKTGPSSEYAPYVINSDLLQSMAKELRKPDGKNIRKIPKRVDMKIPSKNTKNAEQNVALPSPTSPHQKSYVDPSKQEAYFINSDILQSMTKELRKPDGNNIRKIPKRVDMKIPSKNTNNAEQKVALPSPASPHQESYVVPPAPPLPSITLVAPELYIDPPALLEHPLILEATKSLVEPLTLQSSQLIPPTNNID